MPADRVGRIEGYLNRALVAWVSAARRRARSVLVATAIVTAVLLAYTATNLGVNTSHVALLSDDLPFWQQYNEFAEVFPILDEALLVVVEAETSARARDATARLAAQLAAQPEAFESVYVPGGGEFFERHALLYLSVSELEDLADHLASVQPLLAELSRDRSLRGLVRVLGEGVELAKTDETLSANLSAVFDSVTRAAEAVLEGNPRPVSWTEVLLKRSLPGDTSRRLVIVQPVLAYERLLPARKAIGAVRASADRLGLVPENGARVRITGNVALNYEEMIALAREAALAAVGSFALVGCILFFALGSGRLVVATLVTLLVGLVWTGAFATFAVGHLNVVSVAFAVLFIGLGVDFGIHLGMRYAELLRGGADRDQALVETARGVGTSIALCALTTAIGFYVFVPTDYRAVGELGLISGTGMPISLFCTLTVLPALLALGEPGAVGRGRVGSRWFMRAPIVLAARFARPVRLIAAALGVAALCAIPSARFDHNVVAMRDPSTESVKTFDQLLADSDTSPWNIDVMAADLDEAVAVAGRLRELEVVERAVTLRDYVPKEQDEKLEILADIALFVPAPPTHTTPRMAPDLADQIAALRALRDTLHTPSLTAGDPRRAHSARRAVRQLERFMARLETLERKEDALESLEESLLGSLPEQMRMLWDALDPGVVDLDKLPRDLVARMVARDGRARVQALPSRDLGEDGELARFVDGVRAVVPQATGSAVSLLEWARATVRSFQQALVSALIAVSLVVWLLWRRIGDVALVLAPLLLAAALTVAAAALLHISFNFSNVIVLPLLLGIGVDSGIHLVHRYRAAERDAAAGVTGHDILSTSTAEAVFFSALTTMGSFGSLALSSHRGIASLGQLLLIGMALTLVCNLIVLPALISWRRPRASTEPLPRRV